MLLTLKLIALAVCYQDGERNKNRDHDQLKTYPKQKAIHSLPTPLEYLSYLLSAGTLLAGPFFEAKDYFDYINRREQWDQNKAQHKLPNPIVPGTLRFLKAMVCAAVWLDLANRFQVSQLESKVSLVY